jgi:hypothetical protein
MGTDGVVRRVAQGIVVLCAAGGVLVASRHDWPDAALIGLLGVWALVTARKMTWNMRLAGGAETTYSAWPDVASSSRVSPAAPISSSCSSNQTVW